MPRSARVIAIVVVVAGLTGVLHAQEKKQSERATVAGTWTVLVKGSAHGDTTMGLALKQDGQNVTGTFSSPHGDVPVRGKFADGALELETTSQDADSPQVTFTAKLKDDGTLAGYLSSRMGDMTWTAERVKESK